MQAFFGLEVITEEISISSALTQGWKHYDKWKTLTFSQTSL